MRNQNRKHKDLSGKRFGKRTVWWPVGRRNGHVMWLCACDCGAMSVCSGSTANFPPSCKPCGRVPVANLRKYSPRHRMLAAAKGRAKKRKLPFDIDITDIVIPDFCPLLNIPIIDGVGRGRNNPQNSPSLDRKVPSLGYIKGNVWVVSRRANILKNEATLGEMKLILKNWETACPEPI